ncbi:MAG TPA: type II toxin-antitoxin system RelE/ParE family toxin [Clostridiales bacterium]|nr:type II toxin-antitoxin system RelE/ParE family toxin [Clostridiales bacterium]HQP70868.1 type II toxin-antitoxin system RelE/ParE family toxin [Clostridiales bacterium]
MKVCYEASFEKDLKKIDDQKIFDRIRELIDIVKFSESISDLKNVKKLHGARNFYRIRIADYRIGFEYLDDTVVFVRALHRKDIYKNFPK